MLPLGTRVRHRGRDALVIARTLGGHPSYDLRLLDGTLVKYAPEAECEAIPAEAGPSRPAAAPPPRPAPRPPA